MDEVWSPPIESLRRNFYNINKLCRSCRTRYLYACSRKGSARAPSADSVKHDVQRAFHRGIVHRRMAEEQPDVEKAVERIADSLDVEVVAKLTEPSPAFQELARRLAPWRDIALDEVFTG